MSTPFWVVVTNLATATFFVRTKCGRIICAMAKPFSLPTMARKRGNPNWGRAQPFPPAAATEFDIQVRQLGLTKQTCADSAELRTWFEHNRNRCYIPEWLLNEWEIPVNPNFGR